MSSLPPGMVLVLGALAVPFLKGHIRKLWMLALPVVSFLHMRSFGGDFVAQSTFFGYDLTPIRIDALSLVWGYVFHIVAFLTVVYALHVKDKVQNVAGLMYAGSAICAAFAGDLITLFVYWELTAITSVFLIWAQRPERAYRTGLRYLIIQVASGVILLAGVILHMQEKGSLEFGHLGLESLGTKLIFLSFGIKCAFPFLHNWLQDSYPEATPTGTVFLSAFTTKLAVYALARGFAGTSILIPIGATMTLFPIFFAVIENDLRRVLAYSLNNQLGFMVVGIGIGTELAINGTAAHAFAHILYKALLFMGVGAVIQMTGKHKLSEMGGLYKTMPITLGLYMIGAFAISAVPLFSGFVSKSMIMTEAANQGYPVVWFCLLFATAGVVEHAGIKIPYFAFFAHDSGLRPKEAPINMLLAMGIAAFFCIFIGCNPHWLYGMLPNEMSYNPYDATHVITQTQILLFAMLAVWVLMVKKIYPPELPSINLDFDWFYRKGGKVFYAVMAMFWNTLNDLAHVFFVKGIAAKISAFTARGPAIVIRQVVGPLHSLGFFSDKSKEEARDALEKRATLGIHPIGLTALVAILFLLFLLLLVLAW